MNKDFIKKYFNPNIEETEIIGLMWKCPKCGRKIGPEKHKERLKYLSEEHYRKVHKQGEDDEEGNKN